MNGRIRVGRFRVVDATAANACDRCLIWELRHLVAVRAAPYVAQNIEPLDLREAVLDHMTAAWALRASFRGSKDFNEFFFAYCLDVERDVDPARRRGREHTDEYRRVWRNHAHALLGQLTEIEARPIAPVAQLDAPTPKRPRKTQGKPPSSRRGTSGEGTEPEPGTPDNRARAD